MLKSVRWDTVELGYSQVKCAFAMYVVVADGRVTGAPNRAPLSVLCGDLLLGWGAGDLGIQWSPPGWVDNGRMQLHRKLLGHLRHHRHSEGRAGHHYAE